MSGLMPCSHSVSVTAGRAPLHPATQRQDVKGQVAIGKRNQPR
jgi:hypothetical protein